MQVLRYLGALSCVAGLMMGTPSSKQRVQSGLYVIAATECPTDMVFDGRREVISYLSDGRTFLNSDELDRRVILAEVAGRMKSLNDRIVWVRAEPGVSYGDVIGLISDLARDTPNLHVALVTESQGAGPVDPVRLRAAWEAGQRFTLPFCGPARDWYTPIRGRN